MAGWVCGQAQSWNARLPAIYLGVGCHDPTIVGSVRTRFAIRTVAGCDEIHDDLWKREV